MLIHRNTPISSTDEAAGSEVHIYRRTVPGLEPTTTGRDPSALPNLTDELYTDKWRTKVKSLIGCRIGT